MKKPQKKKKKLDGKDNQTSKKGDLHKEEERGFDFGGIPLRDLKKNLGCG